MVGGILRSTRTEMQDFGASEAVPAQKTPNLADEFHSFVAFWLPTVERYKMRLTQELVRKNIPAYYVNVIHD
ncbi:hypothetical protein CU103_23750 [Phyllobacterium sophorae]|jgi:hypothetical protein|uniref:Uncharacterized protein n=1 Tax=Phyllobacterium sophorae TaxID=1520277 RepID=A0A2P7B4J7_9HYPH|nr:hypothetical protein CU103_23750 [Phyllobacterium sophorae]